MKPWWLPDNWLDVGLAIVGVAAAVQMWKLHCRHQYGRKPPRYVIAAVSSVATGAFLSLLCWLDDQPIKQSIRLGLMWGSSAPVIWLGIQQAVLKWAPWLCPAVGADRREGPRTETFSPEKRRELFEDTVQMEKPKKPNGQGGFMSITLIMGVAGALLMGALAVQSYRLSSAQEALGMERVAKELALERIEHLSREKRAAEASLKERDDGHAVITARRVESGQELKGVSDEGLDCPVPDSVRVVLRDRRGGGHAESSPASNATEGVPAPPKRPGGPS